MAPATHGGKWFPVASHWSYLFAPFFGIYLAFAFHLAKALNREYWTTVAATAALQRRGDALLVSQRQMKELVEDSAKKALARLLDDDLFDLVLCDVMMPDMTGMDLYEQVSRASADTASRFLFMTGGTSTERAESFFRDRSHERIDKPFKAKGLIARVQQCVAKARSLEPGGACSSNSSPP